MAPKRSHQVLSPPDGAERTEFPHAQKRTRHPSGGDQKGVNTIETIQAAGKKSRAALPLKIKASINKEVSYSLSSLSPELLEMIVYYIADKKTMNAFGRTSWKFYHLAMPHLYHRIVVDAMFHARIAKLIRTIEPHLTIQQRKRLKQEGKYKGQQERYSTNLDANQKPICAEYVRQLVIGVSDPGKKHAYIVYRYYEELLKNLTNLEVIDTFAVNASMCKSIARLTHLKALKIHANAAQNVNIAPLVDVKNLKHLYLELDDCSDDIYQTIIRNSRTTLQSLHIGGYSLPQDCFQKWTENLNPARHDTCREGRDFPALKALHIQRMSVDEDFVKEFSRAIDISRLRELSIGDFSDNARLLYRRLVGGIAPKDRSYHTPNLRTLRLYMEDMRDPTNHDELDARCAFIASFSTLTNLEIEGFGQYPNNQGIDNPGLPDILLKAILNHENLKSLKISYTGIICGMCIPYVGAKSINSLIDGLSQLREIEFAPDETQMDMISLGLQRGKNLERVTCYPFASWHTHPPPHHPVGINIIQSIMKVFMVNVEMEKEQEEFVWEKHYKLNHLRIASFEWAIATKFGRGGKGLEKPDKYEVDGDSNIRRVQYRRIIPPVHVNIGYDPSFEWVQKVERDSERDF